MSGNRNIILLGYSGHGYVVAEAALLSRMDLKYYAEKQPVEHNPYGLEYVGFENDNGFAYWESEAVFVLGIGDNVLRHRVAEKVILHGRELATIIHPAASVSTYAELGSGTFVARNASINPMAYIGNYCIINTGSIVEHECFVNDGAHIAPGAVLAGNVTIGQGTFIGANAVVKQGITIGKNVVVGAGSVVISNIPDNEIWVGNPSRQINKL